MASASHEKINAPQDSQWIGSWTVIQKGVQYCKVPTQMKEGGMDYLF